MHPQRHPPLPGWFEQRLRCPFEVRGGREFDERDTKHRAAVALRPILSQTPQLSPIHEWATGATHESRIASHDRTRRVFLPPSAELIADEKAQALDAGIYLVGTE